MNRPTLPLLLHTTIGTEATLAFLRETSIVTRKWHLERTEVESGGDEEAVEDIED